MKFSKIFYLAVPFVFLCGQLFAAKYEVFFDSMIIKYDSYSSKIEVEGFGQNSLRIESYYGGTTITCFFSGTLQGNMNINGVRITPAMLAEKAQQQQTFIEQNPRYQPSELSSAISSERSLANRYLLLNANISSETLIDTNTFTQLYAACEYSTYSLITLLQKANFSSINEVNIILTDILKLQLSDPMLVKVLKVVTQKYPSMDLNKKYNIYNKISRDTYRVDAIKLLDNIALQGNVIAIIRTINSDTYKVDTIKVLSNKLKLTTKEALALINEVGSSTYKVDAIKVLSDYLEGISSEQYFAVVNSLSSSYKGDAMKWLPQPQVSVSSQGDGKTNNINSNASNQAVVSRVNLNASSQLINSLNMMSWDDGRLQLLRNFDLSNVSAQETARILRCFTWDDGKDSALRIIMSKLNPEARVNHKQNTLLIVNTFQWDDGKQSAMLQIMR